MRSTVSMFSSSGGSLVLSSVCSSASIYDCIRRLESREAPSSLSVSSFCSVYVSRDGMISCQSSSAAVSSENAASVEISAPVFTASAVETLSRLCRSTAASISSMETVLTTSEMLLSVSSTESSTSVSEVCSCISGRKSNGSCAGFSSSVLTSAASCAAFVSATAGFVSGVFFISALASASSR